MEGAYNITFSLLDKGALEVAGPTGLGRQTILLGRLLVRFQTGRVYDYASFMLGALLTGLLLTKYLHLIDPTYYSIAMLPVGRSGANPESGTDGAAASSSAVVPFQRPSTQSQPSSSGHQLISFQQNAAPAVSSST